MKNLGEDIHRNIDDDVEDYRKQVKKRVKTTRADWEKPETITDSEWAHLPHTQEEFDALPAILSSALGAQYHMKSDDVEGIYCSIMYMAWAYYMLQSREVPARCIDGERMADNKGFNRDIIKDMAKIFREQILRVNDDKGLKFGKHDMEAIKEIYGYEIDD